MSKLNSLIVDAERIKVRLEAPEGEAVLVFKRAPLNEQLEIGIKADELRNKGKRFEAIRLNYNFVFNYLDSVSGVMRQDGTAVGAEDFRALAVPVSFLDAAVAAFNAANNPGTEEPEKNGSSAG